MNPILNIAIRAIRKGGNLIAQYYDSINYKSEYHNKNLYEKNTSIFMIYTRIFNEMFKIIHQAYPQHEVINIYKKKILNKKNITQWIINPLDGKTNFFLKIPHFCLSIAINIKKYTNFSVIYDPIKNDLFTAIKGKGAQLNGFRIRCQKNHIIPKKIITIYYDSMNSNNVQLYLSIMKLLLKENIYIRQFGCSTLDLAYLASGKIDAYINLKNNYLYNLSGELQAKESGALVTDIFEGNNYIDTTNVLIGNSKILKKILKKLYPLKKLKK